ncbi:unnamed protein product, partial [Phaeothamnion confervicola]
SIPRQTQGRPARTRGHRQAPWELLYMDTYGPVTPPVYGGVSYGLQVVDDYTRVRVVYMMRTKGEAATFVKRFILEWGRPRGGRIGCLRGD